MKRTDRCRLRRSGECLLCIIGLTAFLFLPPSSFAQSAVPDEEPVGSVSDTLIGDTAMDTTQSPSSATPEPLLETAGSNTVQSPSTTVSAQPAAPDEKPAASVSDTLDGATVADTTQSSSSATPEPSVETAVADTMQSPSTDSTAADKEMAGVDTTQHARREIPALPLSEAQVKLVTACENYVQLFPKTDQTSQILDIEADVYFTVRDYAKVVSICQRILEEFPQSSYREKSYQRLILAYWEKGEYDEVERWGEELQALNVSEKLKQFARERALGAMIEQAKLLDQSDPALAALEYERIAKKELDPEAAATALFNAADRYMRAEMWEEAANTYRKSAAIYPDGDLADDALNNAAVVYTEKMDNWELAAEVYEELAKSYPQSEYQENSLKSLNFAYTERLKDWDKAVQINKLYAKEYAGTEEALAYEFENTELYVKMGQIDQAIEAYQEFIARHPMDPRAVQARYRLGDLFAERQEVSSAKEAFNEALKTNDAILAAGGEGNDFYALQAAYRIAEMNFQTYQVFLFERPDSLAEDVSRKSTLLKEVLASYGRVNDFPDPEKQLEAVFKIGLAYELFADAYLGRARPSQLDAAEAERTKEIHFAALEFFGKARQTYQTNISRYEEAADALDTLGVEWVASCRKHLTVLPEKEVKAIFEVGRTFEAYADTAAGQKPPSDLLALEQVQFEVDANAMAIDYLDKAAEAYRLNMNQYGEYVAPSDTLGEYAAIAPSDSVEEAAFTDTVTTRVAQWLQRSGERLASIPKRKLVLRAEHLRAYVASFVDFIVHKKWEEILQNPKAKPMFEDMPTNRFALQKKFVETNLFPKIYDEIVPVYEEVLSQAREIEVEPTWLDGVTRDLIWVYDTRGRVYDWISAEVAADFVEKEKRCEAFFKSGKTSALGNDYLGLYDLLQDFAYESLTAYASEAIDYHRETFTYAEDQDIHSDALDSLRLDQMDHVYRLALRYEVLLQFLKEQEQKYAALADREDPDEGVEDLRYAYEDLSLAFIDNTALLYELNLELAQDYGGESGAQYTKESEDGLCRIDPERCPMEGTLQTLELVTDETWLVSNVEEEGWTSLDFSDDHWAPASLGTIPEERSIPNLEDLAGSDIWDAAGSDTVFFRKRFTLPEAPKRATISMGAHDMYFLYVNGLLVERDHQEGIPRDLTDLNVPFSKGENLIAVVAYNLDSDADTTGYGLLCRMKVEMLIPKEEEKTPTGVPQEYLQLATTESLLSPADSLFMVTLEPSEREAFLNYKMAAQNAQMEAATIQADIDALKRALRRVNAEIKRIAVQLDTWNWIIERKEN